MQNWFSVEFNWFYPKIQKGWCCSDSHQELQFVLYTNLHSWPLLKVQLQRKVPDISQLWFFMVQMDTSCGTGTSCPFSSEILPELFLASQEPHSPRFSWCPGICSLCPAQSSLHAGSPQFCPLAEQWEPLQPKWRCSREIWAGLICYHLRHEYTLPFNE